MPLNFCLSGEISCCGAPVVNANIKQGETASNQLAFTSNGTAPLNLTGYSIKMQINFPTPLLLNTLNGGITITNAAQGLAQINIADTTSEGFPVGEFLYDLYTISGSGQSICWWEGAFMVTQGITSVP